MINTNYFIAFILVFLRVLSFFIVIQVFFPKGLPNTVKVVLTLVLSYMIMPGINYSKLVMPTSDLQLIIYCGAEIVTGLVLGYIVNLVFFAIQFAGQLMDMQIGFSMMTMFDPSANGNLTLIQHFMYWFSIMVFFITNTHHILIEELVQSFNTIALGKFILDQNSIMIIVHSFSNFFEIGLKIAIPIILIMMITDLTMGLIARTVPQLNIMIFELPLKILIGLTCIAVALPLFDKLIISNIQHIPEMFKQLYKAIPLALIFAQEDKTEEATPKKKGEARSKGQVAKSKEVSLVMTLLASTMVIAFIMPSSISEFKSLFQMIFTNYLNTSINYNSLTNIVINCIYKLAVILLPMILPITLFGVIGNYIQTGFLFTTEPLKPSFSKLNPISGFKKMFSARSLVELFKDSVIVFIVGDVGYNFVKGNIDLIFDMQNLSWSALLDSFRGLVVSIFFKITLIMFVIAAADFFYQKYKFKKDMKMTKQEVKEEFKQQEGDPQIKGKIKQKQRELAMRRMMQQVPNATVVVTNPTHLAIALLYEDGKSEAPKVVAKGADLVALKIKEVAKESNVPIIENKPLARLIYEKVELDAEIPVGMYQAVAEILALVFKMKKKK